MTTGLYNKILTYFKNNWFVLSYSIILLFIIAIPLIYGYSQQSSQRLFTSVRAPDQGDYWVYFSRIEQTLQGNIFHRYLYSSEVMPKIQFYPIWIIFGFIGKLLSTNSIVTFNIILLAIIPLLVFSLNKLVKIFISDIFWQRMTVVFITLYSGLDWLFWPIFSRFFHYLGFDLNLPDTHVFTIAFHSPHLTACLILMCWIFYSLIKLEQTKNIVYSYWAGFLCLILFLSHPYQIPPVILTLFAYYLITISKSKNYKFILKLLPFIVFNLFVASYLFWLWKFFPLLRLWNGQNQILKFLTWQQSVIFLFSSLGVPYLMSIFYPLKAKLADLDILLYCWVFATLISFFLPIGWAAKSILGITVPLIILSIKFLLLGKNKLPVKQLTIFFFIFFVPCNVYLIFSNLNNYKKVDNFTYYLPTNLFNSLEELKQLPQNSLILAPINISIMIPAIAGRKVFLGHSFETINFNFKCQQANEYFTRPNKKFLLQNSITHVFNLSPKGTYYSLPVNR